MTTEPSNPNDATPPPTPTNFYSFSVIAVDTAGNKSAPAAITQNLDGCGS